MAAIDNTDYAEGFVPELALKQIFAKTRLPATLRRKMADLNFLDVDNFAAISDSASGFRTAVQQIIAADGTTATPDALGDDLPSKAASLAFLAGAWRKCTTLSNHRDGQRARLEEDPTRIPEIALGDYSQMKVKFLKEHPDIILTDFREPHKRFI